MSVQVMREVEHVVWEDPAVDGSSVRVRSGQFTLLMAGSRVTFAAARARWLRDALTALLEAGA